MANADRCRYCSGPDTYWACTTCFGCMVLWHGTDRHAEKAEQRVWVKVGEYTDGSGRLRERRKAQRRFTEDVLLCPACVRKALA